MTALQKTVQLVFEKYQRLFMPKVHYKPIHTYLKAIVDTLKFKPAKFLARMFLVGTYFILLLFATIVVFLVVGMHYTEVLKEDNANSAQVLTMEKYLFGKKRAVYGLDENYLYHGEGLGYSNASDANVVDTVFYYDHGFRKGEWRYYDTEGHVIQKNTYDHGKLLFRSELVDGHWDTVTREDLSFLRRCMEAIIEFSQPYKSGHRHYLDRKKDLVNLANAKRPSN